MADPTGTIGGTHESDVSVAMKGGSKFTDRLNQLADVAERNEKALADLGLGKSLQNAKQEVDRNLANARQQQEKAESIRKEAEEKAKATIDAANKRAAEVAASALEVKKKTEAEATALMKQAEDYAKKVQGDIEGIRKDMEARNAASRIAEQQAKDEVGRARIMAQRAGESAAKADDLGRKLQAKLDRLNAVIRELT